MKIELTPQQILDKTSFRAFVDDQIVPHADRFDRQQSIPLGLIKKIGKKGYLGLSLPVQHGGHGKDMITLGLLHEEVGRACSSVRSLLTVHGMVAQSILRWGSGLIKERWLPRLARGELIGAYGLTEPNVGSDAQSIESKAEHFQDFYILNGQKKWISFGQIADVFLIFAQCDGRPTAFLVERDTPGFSTKPISGMLGTRAAMLAELQMTDCRIPKENIIGRETFGFSHVLAATLDFGRYSVAWGCVGIAQGCFEASIKYIGERKQFGSYLKDYQLIRKMITDMVINIKAARLLCYQAGYYKDIGDPRTLTETLVAKYFASTMVAKVASNAVQIHGAHGCSSEYSVQRYLRDAKIMEIIEGSTQLLEVSIAQYEYQNMALA
ncbi:MAG: acyl-CoA dehydrogenase family protein [Candidatus Sulfotelmatobacter sp.]